ncbi:hypothetical protein [Aestuariivirga litoralis]|uniref:hypothetical protein n=1 Tax=Aestuariivirga litoralis TaxID=2650924 RepID=UPI0018C5F72E|nr:hypothetical protein [Aestuariivirga litoralis]MBG1231672.1 hypothetical protein [Aestuariivirga litoralis]
MSHYLIELLIWVAIAYIIGCILGWLARGLFSGGAAETAAVVASAAPAVASAAGTLTKPQGIKSARGGKADELQRLSGVGPKNETILNQLGFFHFDQIAAWTAAEIDWIDDHLKFGGRIKNEEWVRQASLLAQGKEEQFASEFGTGGMKGKDGQSHSGSHTRK